jgi:exopolysaccharide biosynthesis polyprenyl glycosylphosphotransferase
LGSYGLLGVKSGDFMGSVAFSAADGTPREQSSATLELAAKSASAAVTPDQIVTPRDHAAPLLADPTTAGVVPPRGRGSRSFGSGSDADVTPETTENQSIKTRGWVERYQVSAVVSDLLAASIAGYVAYLVRFMALGSQVNDARVIYLSCCPLLPLLWLIVVTCNRAYESHFVGVGPAEFQRVFRAFLYLTVIVAFVAYATKAEIARGFVIVALPLTLMLTLLGRYALRKQLHRRRLQGWAMSKVIVVGGPKSIAGLVEMLRADVYAGMHVVGACLPVELCDDPEAIEILTAANVPLLGDLDSIRDLVAATGADTIAVTSSQEIGADRLRWISWQLEDTPTDLVVSPGLVEVAGSRLHIRPILGLPLLHVEQPRFTGLRQVIKASIDKTIAVLVLLMLSPLLLTLGVIIRLTSKGPALFKQTRVGRDGRQFTMVKFRSMGVGAEHKVTELVELDEGNGMLFKVRDDPRITPVGRFLRKYSLDELPQLFNVLAGTMSLVGPRPPLPVEVARYQDHVHRRLLVKPGLTGLWQVSGRSDLSWDESVRLDLRYVENWSPVLDLMILWKTLRAVTRGSGAY